MSEAQQVSKRPPKVLQQNHITAKIIREDIWRPAYQHNDWRVFAVVGREGIGKSLTCASILKAADPTFSVDRTHFMPIPFLEDIGTEQNRPGVAVMSDESGVAFGNRTWYDREQIEANQALQTARDYNRIVGMTLPRLEELDVQLEGRLHVLVEAERKRDGEWVEIKWKRMDPTRDGRGKIYKEHPKQSIGGRTQKVTRLKIGPPPNDYIEAYHEKKRQWKDGLFDRVVDRYKEEQSTDEELSPAEIAEEILSEDRVGDYISDNHGQRYLDADLIGVDYDLGAKRSKQVKKVLQREVDDDLL